MHYKKLEKWTSIEWNQMFLELPLVKTDQEKEIIKNILCKSKKGILENKETLKKYGIDNGVGPSYIALPFRFIITLFFGAVENTLHDIGYLIGGTEKERLRSDFGLLKYSILGIGENIDVLCEMKIGIITKIFIIACYLIFSILVEVPSILFCFLMVVFFGGLGSFRYY